MRLVNIRILEVSTVVRLVDVEIDKFMGKHKVNLHCFFFPNKILTQETDQDYANMLANYSNS